MTNRIRIIGCDPSLRNFGIAKGWLDLDTLEWEVDEVVLARTDKSKIKGVRKSLDDYMRVRILHEALREAEKGAGIAFIEMPIGSQSAAAMLSYGACIALAASIEVPLIQVTPTQVKVEAVGDKNATKEEMIAWATTMFPNVNWLRQGKRITGANEHLADACGAINAGMEQHDLKALVNMMR